MEILTWSSAELDEIVEIENQSFSDPWTRAMFLDCLSYPVYHGLVAKEGGQVCGYCFMTCLFEDAEVLNIAVAPAFRGRGLGRELLQTAHSLAQEKNAERCLLEVRKSNAPAIALYESLGYAVYGERKRYYPDGEDALLMRVDL